MLELRGRESSLGVLKKSQRFNGWVHSLIIPSEMSDNEREAFSRRGSDVGPPTNSSLGCLSVDWISWPSLPQKFVSPVTEAAGRGEGKGDQTGLERNSAEAREEAWRHCWKTQRVSFQRY